LIAALTAFGYCVTVAYQVGEERVLLLPDYTPRVDPATITVTALFILATISPLLSAANRPSPFFALQAPRLANALLVGTVTGLTYVDIALLYQRPSWVLLFQIVVGIANSVAFGFAAFRIDPSFQRPVASLLLASALAVIGLAFLAGYLVQFRQTRYEIVTSGPYKGYLVGWTSGEDYLLCDLDLPKHVVSHKCVLGGSGTAPLQFEERETGALHYVASP
jgi:hypothetical protein